MVPERYEIRQKQRLRRHLYMEDLPSSLGNYSPKLLKDVVHGVRDEKASYRFY